MTIRFRGQRRWLMHILLYHNFQISTLQRSASICCSQGDITFLVLSISNLATTREMLIHMDIETNFLFLLHSGGGFFFFFFFCEKDDGYFLSYE